MTKEGAFIVGVVVTTSIVLIVGFWAAIFVSRIG